MTFETILYAIEDRVATITLNRPERYNAMTTIMREELLRAINDIEQDDAVRTVVITGAGKGFCSGGDLHEKRDAASAGTALPLEDRLMPIRNKIVLGIRNSAKPYIAAINGVAAGGGLGIALACDIRIASENARLGLTFLKRGMHPDWGGTYFLPRLVGTAKALELIWSGDMIDAPEAAALGIVSKLTSADALLPTVQEMAARFAKGPPVAARLAKQAVYRNMDVDLGDALDFETYAQNICASTDDIREGVQAFLEKREPNFKGR